VALIFIGDRARKVIETQKNGAAGEPVPSANV